MSPAVSTINLPAVSHNTRQSTRVWAIPTKFQDFVNLPSIVVKTNIVTVLPQLNKFTSAYRAFVVNITHVPELRSYKSAYQCSVWCEAMAIELATLEANKT